jgi:predicted metal-dependent hydrolase
MARPVILPRKLRFDFESVPRHWFAGLRIPTAIANGVNMLFPEGERFFVRSVNAFLDHPAVAADPELVAQVKGFFGQEGKHANAHERYNDMLRAQGYRIDPFLDRHHRFFYGWLEPRMPAQLKLAATAAAEHFTAIMANNAFEDDILVTAHPVMRDLLRWHAAEEIEHKAVAFDVLQKVNPSYWLRIAGLAFSTLSLGLSWALGARMLLQQDGATRDELRAEMKLLRQGGQRDRITRRVFMKGIREYLRRDFHPSQRDNYHLAVDYLRSVGLEVPTPATIATPWTSTASSLS